ncbi:MAG: NAD(P)H-dependent oxidoreductase [Cyanobacteria bacterium P01_H01_bin.105]
MSDYLIHTQNREQDNILVLPLSHHFNREDCMNSDRSVIKPNIIGIVGSYRKHGTIDTAVSEILEAAAQKGAHTEKIYLQDQHIEFCINCRHCLQTPDRSECVLKNVGAASR